MKYVALHGGWSGAPTRVRRARVQTRDATITSRITLQVALFRASQHHLLARQPLACPKQISYARL